MGSRQMSRLGRQISVRLVIIGLVVVVASAVAASPPPAAPNTTTDTASIQQVIRGALVATHTLEAPPASYTGGRMLASTQQEMLARASSVLSQYYTGAQLNTYVQVIQSHIRADQSGSTRYLAGGIDNLIFHEVLVTGLSASVTASVTAWTIVAQDQNGKLVRANPHNTVNYTFSLTKGTGRWLIDGEVWTFAPGSAP